MHSSLSNNPFIDRDDGASTESRYPNIHAFDQATGGMPGGSAYPPQQQFQQGGAGYGGYEGGYGLASQPTTGFYGQQQQQPSFQQQAFQQQPYSPGGSSEYAVASPQGQPQLYAQQTGFYGGQQSSAFRVQQPQQQQQYGYSVPQQQQQQSYQGIPYQAGGADYFPQQQSYGGQLQQYPQQQQQQQYPQQQQTTGAVPYLDLSGFDPLSQGSQAAAQGVADAMGTGPNGALHPLKYIYANRSELEKWNTAAWDGAVRAFEALQAAWEAHRKRCTDAQLAPYVSMSETTRLKELQRTAEQNIDIVAAATLQMSEVRERYRTSMDFSGRARVREGLNAALKNLPSWPASS